VSKVQTGHDPALVAPQAAPAMNGDLPRDRVLGWARKYGSITSLVVLVIVAEMFSSNFLSGTSIRTQLQSFCLSWALIACGQSLVILTGGIDLSVGSLLGMASALCGTLLTTGSSIPVAIVVPILLTTAVGCLSGTIIAKAKIQPIVVTLAMMIAVRGLAELFASDGPVDLSTDPKFGDFTNIAVTQIGSNVPWISSVPISVVIALVVYTLAALFLGSTVLGRGVFAVGGNERAARLSGISPDRVKIVVYAISGLLAGLGGVLICSFNSSSDPFNDGFQWELSTITAVVVGGSALWGGIGSVWRTLVGGLILTVLFAVMVLAGLPTNFQLIANGLVLLGAVILQGGGTA
jgi:ribose transport system permease protein